jgi:hypothetical protein
LAADWGAFLDALVLATCPADDRALAIFGVVGSGYSAKPSQLCGEKYVSNCCKVRKRLIKAVNSDKCAKGGKRLVAPQHGQRL